MHREAMALLAWLLVLYPVGCKSSCADEGSGGADGVEAPGGGNRLRTEDGYEVILSGPAKAKGRTPSKQGERAAAREREHLILEPTEPDPQAGSFTLEEAVVGLPVDGGLVAEIRTTLGTMLCDLYADRTPHTVANFVGLARGLRAWWDPRAGAWVRRPYYRMSLFHRVVPDFMVQGGDVLGDGTGGVGYTIDDERHETLRHDRAGQLCMASNGPNDNGGQFFITDGAAAHLDETGSYTIFGLCRPTEIVNHIARVPQSGRPDHRPLTDVEIERVLIRRVAGGAAAARITRPVPPEGYDRSEVGHEASPGPSELGASREERLRAREKRAP